MFYLIDYKNRRGAVSYVLFFKNEVSFLAFSESYHLIKSAPPHAATIRRKSMESRFSITKVFSCLGALEFTKSL